MSICLLDAAGARAGILGARKLARRLVNEV